MILGHAVQIKQIESVLGHNTHHGLILMGSKGIGKAGIAKILSIDFLKKNSSLPGQVVERQCTQGSYPNYILVTPLYNEEGEQKNEISVEQIRKLITNLKQKSVFPGARIVVIDAVDQLNRQAANALLKMLEEPPLETFFLLIYHQVKTILPTLRSRCMTIPFSALDDCTLTKIIENLHCPVDSNIIPYCLGSVGFYQQLHQAGGGAFLNAVTNILSVVNLNDLKMSIQEILKNVSDTFLLQFLHRVFYIKALQQPNYAKQTQMLDRYLSLTQRAHLDATHRIMGAIGIITQSTSNPALFERSIR